MAKTVEIKLTAARIDKITLENLREAKDMVSAGIKLLESTESDRKRYEELRARAFLSESSDATLTVG